MSANSKHWADVYQWVKKVIDSCETEEQWNSARKLVRLYNKMYWSNNPPPIYVNLSYYLNTKWDSKIK